jgi:hypothetical protein
MVLVSNEFFLNESLNRYGSLNSIWEVSIVKMAVNFTQNLYGLPCVHGSKKIHLSNDAV